MVDSFLYQPHVHESVGVLTPDLLIDRALLITAHDGRKYPLPLHLISSSTSYQQVGTSAGGAAAVVLVSAGSSPLVTVGSAHHDPSLQSYAPGLAYQICAKPLSRSAIRLSDFAKDLPSWYLRTYRSRSEAREGIASTAVTEISGISDVLAQWSTPDQPPRERSVLYISPGHRDPSPETATGYVVELRNDIAGVCVSFGYSIHHLVQ